MTPTETTNSITPAALVAALNAPAAALFGRDMGLAPRRHTLAPRFVGYGRSVPVLSKPEPLTGGESRQVRRAAMRRAGFVGIRLNANPEVRRLSRGIARGLARAYQMNAVQP